MCLLNVRCRPMPSTARATGRVCGKMKRTETIVSQSKQGPGGIKDQNRRVCPNKAQGRKYELLENRHFLWRPIASLPLVFSLCIFPLPVTCLEGRRFRATRLRQNAAEMTQHLVSRTAKFDKSRRQSTRASCHIPFWDDPLERHRGFKIAPHPLPLPEKWLSRQLRVSKSWQEIMKICVTVIKIAHEHLICTCCCAKWN